VLLRPAVQRPAAQLSLVGGLSVARAVESVAGLAALIKWPNDVLVDGCKVAGVLAEQRADAVVLGIGINVNQSAEELPGEARLPAGSLRSLAGRTFEREEVLATLLRELDSLYASWRESGLAALHGELDARDFLRGRRVAVGGVRGIAGGLDEDGRLLVGGHPVESGEVAFG
jgi:BirA family biotin operon repressor/biotin-[acetyl-CoA-carboxylase] ligase